MNIFQIQRKTKRVRASEQTIKNIGKTESLVPDNLSLANPSRKKNEIEELVGRLPA